jgi:hypothetical protein
VQFQTCQWLVDGICLGLLVSENSIHNFLVGIFIPHRCIPNHRLLEQKIISDCAYSRRFRCFALFTSVPEVKQYLAVNHRSSCSKMNANGIGLNQVAVTNWKREKRSNVLWRTWFSWVPFLPFFFFFHPLSDVTSLPCFLDGWRDWGSVQWLDGSDLRALWISIKWVTKCNFRSLSAALPQVAHAQWALYFAPANCELLVQWKFYRNR